MADQIPWYQYPTGLTFGQNGGNEHGVDLEIPFHTQITLPASGTITDISYHDWGGQITWKLDNPVNGVSYMYMIHFDTINSQLKQNGHYDAGTFLGLSGGQNSGGSHPATTQYSTGPHMEMGLSYGPMFGYGAGWVSDIANHPELNPINFLNTIRLSGIQSITTTQSGSSFLSNLTSGLSLPERNPLQPNDSVTQVLAAMDTWMTFVNPFTYGQSSSNVTPENVILGVPGVSGIVPLPGTNTSSSLFNFTGPLNYIIQFGVNLGYDFIALVLKLFVIGLGIFICYKVASKVVDFGAISNLQGLPSALNITGPGAEAGLGGGEVAGLAAI